MLITMPEMGGVQLANPWWVNLCALVPIFAYSILRKHKPRLPSCQLICASLFGIGFAFGEAVVVVYLRAATGLLAGTNLQGSPEIDETAQILRLLPQHLLFMEVSREVATMVMLVTVAFLSASHKIERLALFLWIFATWDIFYYFFLWLTIHWPNSLLTVDVLFLIPVPWMAQVWFPLVVSACTLVAIFINRQKPTRTTALPL
jgi:hypothetical protein